MKYLILFACIAVISSCVYERFYNARLVNDSGKEIKVSVIYNRAVLDTLFKGSSLNPFLNSQGRQSGLPFIVDTTSTTIHFTVPAHKSLMVDQNSGSKPDFLHINELVVESNSNSRNYSRDALQDAFKEVKPDELEFHVN